MLLLQTLRALNKATLLVRIDNDIAVEIFHKRF